jgi:hypothetical protein
MKHTDPADIIPPLTDGLNAIDDVLAFIEAKQDDPRLPVILAGTSGLLIQTCNLFTRRAGAFWKGALAAGFTLDELATLIDVTPADIQRAIDADDERKQAKEQWNQTGTKDGQRSEPGPHTPNFRGRKQTPKRNQRKRR